MKFNATISSPSPLIALGSLIFNGTSIWVTSVGVNQSVPYTVHLDSDEFGAVRTPSNDLLYHAYNLDPNEQHTVTVQPARLLESIIVETDLGDDTVTIMSMDDRQLFEQDGFVTIGQWSTDACLSEERIAGTCYVSEGTGSEISYAFQGDTITLWGAVEDRDSRYQVSVDGVRPISFAPSNATTPRPITVLAHYSGLGPGSHTIKLTSSPSDGRSRIEFDYAHVYARSVAGSSPNTVGPSIASSTPLMGDAPQSQAVGHHLSKSAIIGTVVGTLLGVLALIGLIFIIKRRQKNKAAVAARRRSAALAAAAVAGVRVNFSARRSRDFDEATLASSKFSVKEGLELSAIESQTETKRLEEAAKGR